MRRDATAHRHADAPRHGRAYLRAALVAVTLGLAVALAGCAQSSDTTSAGAGGAAPPTSSTPASATTTTTGTTPSSGTGSGSLTVSPTTGSTQSVMHFAVTPRYAGTEGTGDISNALSVSGPQKAGCVGVHAQGLAALPSGQTTTVSIGPAQLGGSWCPGTYTARVEILERPKCGGGMMCPQFIRVLAAIGPVSFKISG
jgi:hypothetical protein